MKYQRMYLFFYSLLWWMIIPVALLRLVYLGHRQPLYRRHILERLGYYFKIKIDRASKILWVHAVSVGETYAAEPLIRTLLNNYPKHIIVLTHMTPTGRATGSRLFGRDPRVVQCYLPYDTKFMVGCFIRYFRPRLCMLIETEVWPVLIAQCAKYKVPTALLNARLSERSLHRAQRFSCLLKPAFHGLSYTLAQTNADANRLRKMTANNVQVVGNVKFDVLPSDALIELGETLRNQCGDRPILLCASTRDGEERLILNAVARVREKCKNLLLIIVPRHPERFNEVAEMLAERGLPMCRRSMLGDAPVPSTVRVLLGDSMGEMFAYYTCCDVAFIGGSLLPLGGQNLIEACAMGKPVLVGTHTFNFATITQDAINAGVAKRVANADMLMRESLSLLNNKNALPMLNEQAKLFAEQYRGATKRTIAVLHETILS